MALFKKILVPVDFSDNSKTALEMATNLAKAFGSEIALMHCYAINPGGVSSYGVSVPPSYFDGIREAASRKLDEWVEEASAEGIPIRPILSSNCPSEEISLMAEERNADLIVMGTRGNTGLKHLMLGSVAERTLRSAPCPVLTVKTPASA
jgi:nucleotide-binding universal stress UspA family protein